MDNASAEDANHLYGFGINIGIAFQLRDDYLDVYGNEQNFGKKIGGDILCGKRTFLLINALDRGTASQKQTIGQLLGNVLISDDEKIKAITEIYTQLGIDHLCEEEMERYYEKALLELQAISDAKESKMALQELAAQLMGRTD